MWAEIEGHYLNLDGHLQEAHPALSLSEGIHSNLTVITDIADKLGIKLDGNWKKHLYERPAVVALVE